jgi:hypothetical protein
LTANTHVSVLLAESVAALAIQPAGIYLDATFGRGGHSRAILAALGPQGRLIALDRDPAAIVAGASITDPRFTLVHAAFSELGAVLDRLGIGQVDGVLLDIGVSSPQLNTPERGMSFRFDAPLDMRMDTTQGGDRGRIPGTGIAIRNRKGGQGLWRRTVCSCDCKGACCCSGRARYFRDRTACRARGASRPDAGTGSAPGDADFSGSTDSRQSGA